MRRSHPNKQGGTSASGPLVFTATATSNYGLSSFDHHHQPVTTTTTNPRRRNSLSLGENMPNVNLNPRNGNGNNVAMVEESHTRSLQGDELRAHLGIQQRTPAPFSSSSFSFEQYESAYENARSGWVQGESHPAPTAVFGSHEATTVGRISERRRRLSMGSQMELIQAHLESQPEPRPQSFVMPSSVTSRRDELSIRTAPSSRANSAPRRPLDDNPYQPGTARALQFDRVSDFDRVSESLPSFKPCDAKTDFYREEFVQEKRGATTTTATRALENHHHHHSFIEFNHLPIIKPVSKSESHTPIPQSPRGSKQNTPTKYLSARAVAERLAKAIRGGSKSSKNKVDNKISSNPNAHDAQEASGALSDSSSNGGGKAADPWPETYARQLNSEQALDHSGIFAEFNEFSQITSFRDRKMEIVPREENKEVDLLKGWLESMKQQGEGIYDDLEKKAQATCERLAMLDEEQALLDDRLMYLSDGQGKEGSERMIRNGDSMVAIQQRLRKMHEEKKHLALEAASELRRRISERTAARKVFTLMKREMDAYAKVMEKEKAELQTNLEDEIARRESSWVMKLDRVRAEERELRERVMKLQEENTYIQREIGSMSSKDGQWKGKIKELEFEIDSYRTRAEQAESELDALHKIFSEKENENRNLRKIVERLPKLCGDYENRISSLQQNLKDGRFEDIGVGRKPSKLQRELSRLSSLEVALRSEMQVLKGNSLGYQEVEGDPRSGEDTKSAEEVRVELDRLQKQSVELQDENNLLCVKLRLAVREKEDMKQALREAEEDIQELRSSAGGRGQSGADQLVHSLQRLRMDESVEQDTADSQPLQVEGRHDHQASWQLNARAEAMNDQLQVRESQLLNMKHEFGKQEDAIRGLEHSLSVAGKTVEAQKARILRLSARNEELVRLYHSKESEVQDLRVLSSAEAESRKVCEQELVQMKEQALKFKQELRAQDLNCKLLKEKLTCKEAELEQRNDDVVALEQRRDWLEAEVLKLQRFLGEANQKFSSLERQFEDQKEKIKNLQTDVEGHVKELCKLKDQLPRIKKERDDLSLEAEQMGREALRLSTEVEVLRRKVHELDEDVMVRDGQISILCNSLDDRE